MEENETTYREQNLFESSQDVQTLIQNVNRRLGFIINEVSGQMEDEGQLVFKDIEVIYDICRYEAAWHPQNASYWCAAFSEEDLKVTCYT